MKKKYTYFIIIFLIAVSCVAFCRIAGNDFINYDDNEYITENYQIQSGINLQTLKWAFTTTYCSYWHPLTWISHMLDWSMFGPNASAHHLVSLLFHIGSSILFFLFLNKTTNNVWSSAFAAAFFALHPLRVESVAWVSERKDVLSMFFGMATLYAYAFYAEKSKLSNYFLCLILFFMGLMSKPTMVTLPFVLILLDYWPLKRLQKGMSRILISEKVPFIILAMALSILTLWAQVSIGTVSTWESLPFLERITNAIFAYAAYLGKIFYPVNLAVFYPYNCCLPLWKTLISAIILILITIAALYYIKKLPFLFVGWFTYLGTLVTVIGLIQVGRQAMADRYTYFPSVGIAFMLAWGIPAIIKSEKIRKKILFPGAITALLMMVVLTWRQCSYWKNSTTIFSHALQATSDNYLAHTNLAIALANDGKNYEAIDHYNKAILIEPDIDLPYYNRGISYVNTGQYQLAIDDYSKAIILKSDNIMAYNNRGIAYAALHQYQQAIETFNTAISLKNNYADAYRNRGLTYFNQGKKELGCLDAQKACELGNCKALKLAQNKRLCH